MARPRKDVDVVEVQRLRQAGCSVRRIASELSIGVGTVHRTIHAVPIAPGRSKTQALTDYGVAGATKSTSDYSIEEIKQWRQAEFEAGRPSRLQDFFNAHSPVEEATIGAPA